MGLKGIIGRAGQRRGGEEGEEERIKTQIERKGDN